jgi:hypothetical protein
MSLLSEPIAFISVDYYAEKHYTFRQTTTSISQAPAGFSYCTGVVRVSLHIATTDEDKINLCGTK